MAWYRHGNIAQLNSAKLYGLAIADQEVIGRHNAMPYGFAVVTQPRGDIGSLPDYGEIQPLSRANIAVGHAAKCHAD